MTAITVLPGHRVRDNIAVPDGSMPLEGRARRVDRYPIHVTRSSSETLDRLAELARGRSVAIVTDDVVEALYAGRIVDGLRELGCEVLLHSVPPGETSKSIGNAVALWDWLASTGIGRRDVIVNLGGGVINDLGGWVASGYMRGIPYVNLPTTLLAQVDGALGGKVAVNHESAKNLLGAFYQPAAVIANVSSLRSLERRHIAAGLAECIKKAVIASPAYWEFIRERLDALLDRDDQALEQLVRGAAAIKSSLVERDPYERDLRRPLNFGHTIGHPLETITGYGPLLHGEAVAFGMVVESRLASARGLLDADVLEQLIAILRRSGLPTEASELPVPVTADAILGAMEKVRLIRAGSLRYVLPIEIGETLIANDVDEEEARDALAACHVR